MLHQLLHEKTAQVSLVSGVLFFVIASQPVFKFVEDLLKKVLNVSLSGTPLLLLHSVLFAVLVSVLTFHVFRPLLGWNAEGQDVVPGECAPGFERIGGSSECTPISPSDPEPVDIPDVPPTPDPPETPETPDVA